MRDIAEEIGLVTCRCGGCCNESKMCERCMESTLKANGFEVNETNMNQLRSVKKDNKHCYGGGYSDYTWLIRKMDYERKEAFRKSKEGVLVSPHT